MDATSRCLPGRVWDRLVSWFRCRSTPQESSTPSTPERCFPDQETSTTSTIPSRPSTRDKNLQGRLDGLLDRILNKEKVTHTSPSTGLYDRALSRFYRFLYHVLLFHHRKSSSSSSNNNWSCSIVREFL